MFSKPSDVKFSKVERNNTIGEEESDQEDEEGGNFAAIMAGRTPITNLEEKAEDDEYETFTTAKTRLEDSEPNSMTRE